MMKMEVCNGIISHVPLPSLSTDLVCSRAIPLLEYHSRNDRSLKNKLYLPRSDIYSLTTQGLLIPVDVVWETGWLIQDEVALRLIQN